MRAMIFYLFLFTSVYLAQNPNEYIFPDREVIINHNEYKNNLTVVTLNYNFNFHSGIYIFNNNASLIWERKFTDREKIILNAFQVSDDNIVFIEEGDDNESETNDKIFCINFKTGQQIWTAESVSDDYRLSQDNNYLITRCSARNRTSEFTIFNTKNGEKIPLNFTLKHFVAEWLDNNRIVMSEPIIRKEVVQESNELVRLQREMEIINKNKHNLYARKHQKVITENEFRSEKDQIKEKKKKLFKEIRKEKRKNNFANYHKQVTGVKLSIFDIADQRFLFSKEIKEINGTNCRIQRSAAYRNILKTYKNNIYLVAEGENFPTSFILKYDKSLNLVSSIPIRVELSATLRFFNYEDQIYLLSGNQLTEKYAVNLSKMEIIEDRDSEIQSINKQSGLDIFPNHVLHSSKNYSLQGGIANATISKIIFKGAER